MEADYYFIIIIAIAIFPQGETAMTFKERLKEPEIRKIRPYFHKKKTPSLACPIVLLETRRLSQVSSYRLQSIGRHLLSSYSWGR